MREIALAGMLLLTLGQSGPSQILIHRAVEIEIPTEPNKFYQIQSSPDMATWMNLGNEIVGTGSPVFRLFSTHGEAYAFHRFIVSNTNTQLTIDIASYANLCGRWSYRRTKEGTGPITTWAVKVLGTMTEQAHPVYLLQEYDENEFPNDQAFLDTDLSEGLSEMGGLNDYGKPTEAKWYWGTSVPRLMKTFVPGVEYTNSFTRTDMPGVVITMRMKTETETITVPYGTLNCFKVTRTLAAGAVQFMETAWHAKHLGLVKRDQRGGDLWELTAYAP
jgi:hypothetical protein